MKIEIYSDVMCPWCYIGERRLDRALAAVQGSERFEVVFRPFQLDVRGPAEPVPMPDYLRNKFGDRQKPIQDHVAEVGRGEGIEFDFENGVIVNTFTAHRVLRLAEGEYGAGVQRRLAEELFAAHFERGADVSDPEVLTRLAAAAGMDAERVRRYLESGEGSHETRADLARALEVGVRAVPTFVFDGRYAVAGAQPVSAFVRVLDELVEGSGQPADAEPGVGEDGSSAD